jgi:hypothetical protein
MIFLASAKILVCLCLPSHPLDIHHLYAVQVEQKGKEKQESRIQK